VKMLRDLEKLGFKLDFLASNVDEAIRRAIAQYGAEAVKKAVEQQTKAKRGRPSDPDWLLLRPTFELDAREWLNDVIPQKNRTNYRIAKDFADKEKGHSYPATLRRIQQKLKNKRILFYLFEAVLLSREGYSYKKHLKALEAFAEINPFPSNELEIAQKVVAGFELRFGKYPADNMSIVEIQRAVLPALDAGPTSYFSDPPKGLGALADYRQQVPIST